MIEILENIKPITIFTTNRSTFARIPTIPAKRPHAILTDAVCGLS